MNQLLSVGLIAVIAIGILFLSQIRKKRIQPYIDAFATAFCEVSEHILPKEGIAGTLAVKPLEAGRVRALPKEQQPEPIRALIEKGVDESHRMLQIAAKTSIDASRTNASIVFWEPM